MKHASRCRPQCRHPHPSWLSPPRPARPTSTWPLERYTACSHYARGRLVMLETVRAVSSCRPARTHATQTQAGPSTRARRTRVRAVTLAAVSAAREPSGRQGRPSVPPARTARAPAELDLRDAAAARAARLLLRGLHDGGGGVREGARRRQEKSQEEGVQWRRRLWRRRRRLWRQWCRCGCCTGRRAGAQGHRAARANATQGSTRAAAL